MLIAYMTSGTCECQASCMRLTASCWARKSSNTHHKGSWLQAGLQHPLIEGILTMLQCPRENSTRHDVACLLGHTSQGEFNCATPGSCELHLTFLHLVCPIRICRAAAARGGVQVHPRSQCRGREEAEHPGAAGPPGGRIPGDRHDHGPPGF